MLYDCALIVGRAEADGLDPIDDRESKATTIHSRIGVSLLVVPSRRRSECLKPWTEVDRRY